VDEAVIVDCLRTAVGKAPRGTLKNTRPDDLAAAVFSKLLEKYPQVERGAIDDVILGCANPEAESGMNVARIAAMRAGLPDSVPGVTINRFCSSGLQAIAMAAEKIRSGGAEIILAGGAESMSLVPMSGHKFAPNPWLVDNFPQIYMGMGLTAEEVYRKYKISREEQDAFAYRSHQNALKAQAEGKFNDEIVPVEVEMTSLINETNGNAAHGAAPLKPSTAKSIFKKDEGPRADTSMEALGKLRAVFHAQGTVTAGNSSQTSDGAAAAIVMSEKRAKELGLKPMARFVSFAVGGVPPELMGIGPIVAVPKALKLAGLKLSDIDVVELNEAFAVQALAVAREVGLNMETLNVNGGAIALGHPLGCTGAKLTATILREMQRRGSRYGMVTMCIGGGQGAAGIFERLN
jgi:acetyl-CoA acyltransferase